MPMTLDTLHQLKTGQLAGARQLKLACGLTQFPSEIFDLADTLEVLDLSGNDLSDLPPDLPRLHRLRVLFASNNQFTHLPTSIGLCSQLSMVGFKANQIREVSPQALPPMLRWLILTDNQIARLPVELGERPALQKLMLAGNRLQALPDLSACHRLELLRIAANQLNALPGWLLQMPRLTWLAYAGNPWCTALEAAAISQAQASAIPATELDMGSELGQGASGVIHEATWRSSQGPQAVALKRFKGAMTSDGLPRSEMAACLAAGQHAHLIGVHGLWADAQGDTGLLMQRIGTGHAPLAGPPSFESCTRDVYPASTPWPLARSLTLLQGIASAAAHLHAHGILHGDLYAHNILHDGRGQGLLGDFGAASFLPVQDAHTTAALTRLEVRAMGGLIKELLAQAAMGTADQTRALALATLSAQCRQADVAARPSMAKVHEQLTTLSSP